eukprot:scaffold620_cov386-Prasinococcus_capsulatus_cf.AAC.15
MFAAYRDIRTMLYCTSLRGRAAAAQPSPSACGAQDAIQRKRGWDCACPSPRDCCGRRGRLRAGRNRSSPQYCEDRPAAGCWRCLPADDDDARRARRARGPARGHEEGCLPSEGPPSRAQGESPRKAKTHAHPRALIP